MMSIDYNVFDEYGHVYSYDVKDKFGIDNIKDFPKDFDVKELHDDLNICDECGDICNWEQEMYWQGDCEETWHEFLHENGCTAVCDTCFEDMRNKSLMKEIEKVD